MEGSIYDQTGQSPACWNVGSIRSDHSCKRKMASNVNGNTCNITNFNYDWSVNSYLNLLKDKWVFKQKDSWGIKTCNKNQINLEIIKPKTYHFSLFILFMKTYTTSK